MARRPAVRFWNDLQEIKNQLAGAEGTAVEVFPARAALVDEVNMYHLWIVQQAVAFALDLSALDC
jgi:hypothetical protein